MSCLFLSESAILLDKHDIMCLVELLRKVEVVLGRKSPSDIITKMGPVVVLRVCVVVFA